MPKRYIYWYCFQVAIIFTCSRLARNTVYTYLPLFLTERLQFAKVNIVSVSTILFPKLYTCRLGQASSKIERQIV